MCGMGEETNRYEVTEEKRRESLKTYLDSLALPSDKVNQIMIYAERWADAAFKVGRQDNPA
jgi:hypothetical protein